MLELKLTFPSKIVKFNVIVNLLQHTHKERRIDRGRDGKRNVF